MGTEVCLTTHSNLQSGSQFMVCLNQSRKWNNISHRNGFQMSVSWLLTICLIFAPFPTEDPLEKAEYTVLTWCIWCLTFWLALQRGGWQHELVIQGLIGIWASTHPCVSLSPMHHNPFWALKAWYEKSKIKELISQLGEIKVMDVNELPWHS